MKKGIHETNHDVCPKVTLTGKWRRAIGTVCMVLAVTAVSRAQGEQPSPNVVKFKTLVDFGGTIGGWPSATLVQGTDGNLYGTTWTGGANGGGIVFKMSPSGSLTTIYGFCAQPSCADGAGGTSLVLATDGNFYGTNQYGAANGAGTVFKITPAGSLTTLWTFCCGQSLGIVRSTSGNFFGTTFNGGSNSGGTIFKIIPNGTLTTLYNSCAQPNCADGNSPYAQLTQAMDGNFYGTTQTGGIGGPFGAGSGGTIFKITPGGALTSLYSFCLQSNCPDGAFPAAALVQAANGDFYGTTPYYGANGAGTIFKMTPSGTLTTVYDFCAQPNCTDGGSPASPLIQATDGNLYGLTSSGGATSDCFGTTVQGCGTAFRFTPGGALTTLHSFNGTDGWPNLDSPTAPALVQATNGVIYGAANDGGQLGCIAAEPGCGTIFSLSVGLGPFVKTLPASAEVGASIKILGNELTTATSVSFNGTAAAFTVDSKTLISATVPSGTTTGFVTVTGPSATLKSNVKFRVR